MSPNQVRRASELAQAQGIKNVSFSVMDALNMSHEDDKYDLVWACESGEHMPDKRKYVEEMIRVLKPGTYEPHMTPRSPYSTNLFTASATLMSCLLTVSIPKRGEAETYRCYLIGFK